MRIKGLVLFLITSSFISAAVASLPRALAQDLRLKLVRIGDIGFGTSFDDARETADAHVGIPFATGDKRSLKTLAQTKVALFDTSFNLTYVFGNNDRLTRVFGSVVRAMDMDRNACLTNGANLFAATVRRYGSPDLDRLGQFEREWRFDFADGRWIKLRYYFGGILNACNIIIEAATPEGRDDHT